MKQELIEVSQRTEASPRKLGLMGSVALPDVAFPYRPMRLVIGGRVSFGPPVVTAGAKLAVERLERVGA